MRKRAEKWKLIYCSTASAATNMLLVALVTWPNPQQIPTWPESTGEGGNTLPVLQERSELLQIQVGDD